MMAYSSGGHHPAYLVSADRKQFSPLATRRPLIGATDETHFPEAHVRIASGTSLHIFSDGVFEIADKQGRQLGLNDFLPLLNQPAVEGRSEPQRLYQTVRNT